MKILFIILFLSLTGASCQMGPSPAPKPPPPTIEDIKYCQAAENNLKALCNAQINNAAYCCTTVAPTLRGKSFTQFCQEVEIAGISIGAQCLSTATSCQEIDVCSGTKGK